MTISDTISLNFEATQWWVILLSLVPCVINIGIFIYCYYFINRNRLTIIFSNFLLCLIIWQFGDTLLRITDSIKTAELFYRTYLLAIILLPAIGLHFTLSFFELIKNKYSAFVATLIYAPAVIFMVINLLRINQINLIPTFFGFTNTTHDLIEVFWRFWMSLLALITIAIQFYFYKFSIHQGEKNKKIAMILFFGYAIPSLQGITTQAILPIFMGIPEIPLTTTFATFFSFSAIIALKKYNLFDYSQTSASQQVLDIMSEGIVITDKKGKIQYANNALCTMLNYQRQELYDSPSYHVISADEKEKVAASLKSRLQGKIGRYETKVLTKEGKELNVSISASPFYDKNQRIQGSLRIITNITALKNQRKIVLSAMLAGEEKERKRFAQELHDGIAQYLTAININITSIGDNIPPIHYNTLQTIKNIVQETINETRSLAHNLLPKGIEKDLDSSLHHLVDGLKNVTSIKIEIQTLGKKILLSNSIKFNLYRISQEFINNSIKHAKAKKLNICLKYNSKNIEFLLSDDGIGFEVNSSENKGGLGLIHIKQRSEAINANIKFNSKKGIGTKLKLIIPF